MAIDNTPPRLRLIATIAIIMVTTLVGLEFVFRSYYAFMSDQAKYEKLAPTREKSEQLAAEQASLASAKLPLEQAMMQVARGARSMLVEPRPSDDTAAMTGWSKMPKQIPLPAPDEPQAGSSAPASAGPNAGPGATDAGTLPPPAVMPIVTPAGSKDGAAPRAPAPHPPGH